MTPDPRALALEALAKLEPYHRPCEDGYYACPMSEDSFGHEGSPCDCGYAEKKAALDLVRAALDREERAVGLLRRIDASMAAGGWDAATCAAMLDDNHEAEPACWLASLRAFLASLGPPAVSDTTQT